MRAVGKGHVPPFPAEGSARPEPWGLQSPALPLTDVVLGP